MRITTFDYRGGDTGEVLASASAVQFPDIPCKAVKFTAHPDNDDVVAYAPHSGVTLPAGTLNTTAGTPLGPGAESAWLPSKGNLNNWYYIMADTNQKLTYHYIK